MSVLCHMRERRPLSRREMLHTSSVGFGALALQGLLAREGHSATALSPRPSPAPARAKRIIFIFMHGGPSQVDLFDHKPQLTRDDDKPLPFEKPRIVSAKTGNLLASPWNFSHHGQTGAEVSELLPHLSSIVDDLCIVKSIHGSNSRHGGALLELHTGSDTFTRPAMGSWITYGLGTENQNLPGFITINPTGGHGGSNAWSSAFLPAHFQGVLLRHPGLGAPVWSTLALLEKTILREPGWRLGTRYNVVPARLQNARLFAIGTILEVVLVGAFLMNLTTVLGK